MGQTEARRRKSKGKTVFETQFETFISNKVKTGRHVQADSRPGPGAYAPEKEVMGTRYKKSPVKERPKTAII